MGQMVQQKAKHEYVILHESMSCAESVNVRTPYTVAPVPLMKLEQVPSAQPPRLALVSKVVNIVQQYLLLVAQSCSLVTRAQNEMLLAIPPFKTGNVIALCS